MLKCVTHARDKAEFVDFKKADLGRKFFWLDVENPSKEELKVIVEKTGIPTFELKICLDRDERARVENEKDYSLIVFRAPHHKNEKEIAITSASIFISRKFVVTVHLDHIDCIKKALKEHEMFVKKDFQHLVYYILLQNNREFDKITDELGEHLDKIETRLLKNHNIEVEQIFNAKKTLLYFRKALVTNRDVAFSVYKGHSKFITSKSLFADLHTEIAQQVDEEELLRGRLTESVSIYLSSTSNKLNEIMKSFTVIASLLLIPMLISGVYGMNFKHIPLAFHLYGFYITIGIMVVSMIVAFLFFRKLKWI